MISVQKLVFACLGPLCGAASKRQSFQYMLFNAIRLNRFNLNEAVIDENIRFLTYCMSRRHRSRAQILQDLWVCYELGEKNGGFFVEFGATNGIKNSNTWLLEKDLGWRGILAEPNPIWHSDLFRSRSAFIDTRCVSSDSGKLVPFLATDDVDPELSGIASFSNADHFAAVRSKGKVIELETISLDDLLDKYSAPQEIDYLSIDTEGSELEILSSYSFRHSFKLISVENNRLNEKSVDDLLRSRGYIRVFRRFSQWDSWFVASSLRSGDPVRIVVPDA